MQNNSLNFNLDSFKKECELFDQQPRVKGNLLSRDGVCVMHKEIYSPYHSEGFFKFLLNKVNWQQHEITMFGKTYPVPRQTAWFGPTDYKYSGITETQAVQQDAEVSEWIRHIIWQIGHRTGNTFNSVLLNLYRGGNDSVAWHSDDEAEYGVNPVIASLSFGAARTFKMRHKQDKKDKVDIILEPGSLLVMSGKTQECWEHSIPKTAKPIGPRINLTFRNIITK
jgi:alkylated DNA repair dioxygenase AlkB